MDGETQQVGGISGLPQPAGNGRGDTTISVGPCVDERVADHLAEPPFCFGQSFDRYQADAERAPLEHELGIEIGVAEPHAEVHRSPARPTGVPCVSCWPSITETDARNE